MTDPSTLQGKPSPSEAEVERVAGAMRRYSDGAEVRLCAGPPRWLIWDNIENRQLPDEVYATRALRNARIEGLNARAAITASRAALAEEGMVICPREPTTRLRKIGAAAMYPIHSVDLFDELWRKVINAVLEGQ